MTKKFLVPINAPGGTLTDDLVLSGGTTDLTVGNDVLVGGDLTAPVIYSTFVVPHPSSPTGIVIGGDPAATVDTGGSSLITSNGNINTGDGGVTANGGIFTGGLAVDNIGTYASTTLVIGANPAVTIDTAGSAIEGLPTPTANDRAANKGYVDDEIGAVIANVDARVLDDLADVDTTGVANGDLIVYQTGVGWVVWPAATSHTHPLLGDGDKGDITVGGTGTTLTIENDAVSNAKLANVATQTIKGRTTASTGDPEDLTAAQARSMLASGAGSFFGFDFDTTTSAGSASTRLRLNNATPASATAVYVSYTSKDAVDLKVRLLAGTAGDRLFIQDRDNSANYRVYELTSTPTDNTTYATCAVVHRGGAGSLWANSEEIVAGFTSPPITVGTTAPSSPMTNDIWIDTT